jgi:hypothetical protein
MISNKETVAIGWCDNGNTDGKFTEGLMLAAIAGKANGMKIDSSIRVNGNQIGRQRQVLFDQWADNLKTDWLLWVDSDIVLNLQAMKKLWEAADKNNKKVVSGIYFISKENEASLMKPFPTVFKNISDYQIQYIHPLPIDEVIECDSAGMGFVLMHKSIIPTMRKKFTDQSMFAEQEGVGDKYVGEDIVFFRKLKEAGIQLYAHTGAIVKHIKRFSLDYDYYYMYWTHPEIQKSLNTAE